ncbi:MAG TPA: TlpA disulfide reductase family protein [Candidatus Sulfotelmatobacter sp.]|nr:TlpA disulfide reductase family protein [Candidatus Sulfotelmatobacter sp.]
MTSRRLLLWLGVAIAAVSIGCSKSNQEMGDTSAARATDSDMQLYPPVTPTTAEQVLARARRGDATIVNLWATWCPPCRDEMPALIRVARVHKEDRVRLVLVSVDFEDQLPAVRKFLATQGYTDTSYLKTGDDQKFINAIYPQWTGALPATLVFDRSGRQVAFWEGRADESKFEHAVIEALAANTH